MSRTCTICGKSSGRGNHVSHANNKTKRVLHPNLQTVRAQVDGGTKSLKVCTRCIRSGKITKAA